MRKSAIHNVVQFESLTEFANFCKGNDWANRYSEKDDWVNYTTGDKSCEFAIHGKNECVEEANKLIDSFDMVIPSSMYEDIPAVAGCYPCVPDAIMGDPESMREPVLVESSHAPLTIVVDLICSASFSYKEMQNRGAAVTAFVMAMSSTRPVTLKLCSTNCGPKQADGNKYSIVSVDIATTPIDLATTAYTIVDVSFVRNLLYGYQKEFLGSRLIWPQIEGANCVSEEFANKVKEYLEVDGDWVYIPPAWASNYDKDLLNNPVVWVKKMLEKYQAVE